MVRQSVISLTKYTYVSGEIYQAPDRRSVCDDQAHVIERGSHVLHHDRSMSSLVATVEPSLSMIISMNSQSKYAHSEAYYRRYETSLATISGSQHESDWNQQTPEYEPADVALHRREDRVELDHLQRLSDRLMSVTLEIRELRRVNLNLRSETMCCCNQVDQKTNVHGCLPMAILYLLYPPPTVFIFTATAATRKGKDKEKGWLLIRQSSWVLSCTGAYRSTHWRVPTC